MKRKILLGALALGVALLITVLFYNLFVRTWKAKVEITPAQIQVLDVFSAKPPQKAQEKLQTLKRAIDEQTYPVFLQEPYAEITAEVNENEQGIEEILFTIYVYDTPEDFAKTNHAAANALYVNVYIDGAKQAVVPAEKTLLFTSIDEMETAYQTIYGKNRWIFERYAQQGQIGDVRYSISPVAIESKNEGLIGLPFLNNTPGRVDAVYEMDGGVIIKILEFTPNNASQQAYALYYIAKLMQ